jgi:hypothetical protein
LNNISVIRELGNLPAKSLAGKSRILAIRKFMKRPPKTTKKLENKNLENCVLTKKGFKHALPDNVKSFFSLNR